MQINSLSDIYPKNSVIFSKYPEPKLDYWSDSTYKFIAWDYPPATIHTEAARILPVIWESISILLEEKSIDHNLMQYMHDYFPCFSRKNIISYSDGGHIEAIRATVQDRALYVLHPYDAIPEKKYAIPWSLIQTLNDKTLLHRLSTKIPKRSICNIDTIGDIKEFPIVIKWRSWASGDGVKIIYNHTELQEAIKFFWWEEELLVEEFLTIEDNFNIQLAIKDDKISILWISRQYTNSAWEYNGNIILRGATIPQQVQEIAVEACERAKQNGFRGVCWLDIVKDKFDQYYLIDPNFRINGSTSTLLFSKHLFKSTNAEFIRFGSFETNTPVIKDIINVAQLSDDDTWFAILSAYPNKEKNNNIKWYGIYYGPNERELPWIQKKLQTQWILF